MSSFSTIVKWLLGVCAASTSLWMVPHQATAKASLARVDFTGKTDSSFNGGKNMVLDIPDTTEATIYAATKLGSKIVIAGAATTTSGKEVFMVGRLNDDGSPDTTFSGDGFALTNFNSTESESVTAVAIDSEQRIVVAGTADGQFALARYNNDGSLDPNFDGDGKVLTSFPGTTGAIAAGIAIDGGKIVVAGSATPSGSNEQFAVARYNSNGTLDSTFSGDGLKLIDFMSTPREVATAVAIDGLGRIVVAGRADDFLNHYQIPVARLTYYGELDTDYDSDGKVLINFSTSLDIEEANSVLVDSDNRIVIGGRSDGYFALARTTTTGAMDPTFGGGDGMVRTNFSSQSQEIIFKIAFSGEMIVAVGAGFTSSDKWKYAAAVYDDEGNLWTSFDVDGKVLVDFDGCHSIAYATVVTEDTSILMAGSCY
jgi:uncharacterized delta-60 repeat protein